MCPLLPRSRSYGAAASSDTWLAQCYATNLSIVRHVYERIISLAPMNQAQQQQSTSWLLTRDTTNTESAALSTSSAHMQAREAHEAHAQQCLHRDLSMAVPGSGSCSPHHLAREIVTFSRHRTTQAQASESIHRETPTAWSTIMRQPPMPPDALMLHVLRSLPHSIKISTTEISSLHN
jgi:hypothetical protein